MQGFLFVYSCLSWPVTGVFEICYIPVMLKRIYIEISNICNLQCSFCPVVERDNLVMNADNFKKVLAQAKPLAEEVCLHLMGEPTTHPDFSKIIRNCHSENIPIQLTTNGVNISQKKKLLLENNSIRQINLPFRAIKIIFQIEL